MSAAASASHYDGSNTDFHSSMNYTVQEYANDVIAFIGEGVQPARTCRTRRS